jgi:hypothetical protein
MVGRGRFPADRKSGAEQDCGEGPDNDNAVAGYCHAYGSYADRIGGYYYGGGIDGAEDEELIERLWAQAGNEVQWAPMAERAARLTRPKHRKRQQ